MLFPKPPTVFFECQSALLQEAAGKKNQGLRQMQAESFGQNWTEVRVSLGLWEKRT